MKPYKKPVTLQRPKEKSTNPSSERDSQNYKIMKTTFKTFAFAAMMTVFGATTAFANNHNHKYNNTHNNHAPKMEVKMNTHHNDLMKEYEMAKHCNCKNCREFVKKIEKQMRKNYKNNCHCNYCQNLNKANVHNGHGNGHIATGGRRYGFHSYNIVCFD